MPFYVTRDEKNQEIASIIIGFIVMLVLVIVFVFFVFPTVTRREPDIVDVHVDEVVVTPEVVEVTPEFTPTEQPATPTQTPTRTPTDEQIIDITI